MTYEIEGCDSWASSGIHFNYDSEISPATTSNGDILFTRGSASSNMEGFGLASRTGKEIHNLSESITNPKLTEMLENVTTDQTCVFVFTASSDDTGKNGVITSVDFTIPDTATAGEVYSFEFWQMHSDIFTNSNMDSDMQDYAFANWQNGEIIVSETGTNKKGDANIDGLVTIADSIAVSAFVSNSSKNPLSEQCVANADVHGNKNGLNAGDAFTIQQFVTGVISDWEV